MTAWTAIIPVKPWALAKTRLLLSPDAREALAHAFTCDVVESVAMSRHVDAIVIVSAEAGLRGLARDHEAVLIEDRPMRSADGVNQAILTGVHWCRARRPETGVVVIPADLPALTADVLDEALAKLAGIPSAFVPDAMGHGTTLLTAQCVGSMIRPAYGKGSAAAHRAQDAKSMLDVDVRLRLDVDTAGDLAQAHYLGLGRHSLAACQSTQRGEGISRALQV